MEYDIKLMLVLSPGMRLQWKEIFNPLYSKYEKEHKTKNSFSVTLHRKLGNLIHCGDLEKEEKGHQQVFYFVPKKHQKRVVEELERAYVFKKFDEFWDAFSLDQRKKIVRDFTAQQHLFILIMRNFSLEFLKMAQEYAEPWISRLENPTEDIKAQYSPEERKQFLKEFHDGQKELEKIKSNIVRDSQPISNEEFRELMKLTQEFMDEVVPKYPRGWREAITDLMRKAIAEENKRNVA